MGTRFLADCRKKLKEMEDERNSPYVSWKDYEEGNIALLSLPVIKYGIKQHHAKAAWKFPFMGVGAVKVFDMNDNIALHWNLWDHDLPGMEYIRCPVNDHMKEEIAQHEGASVLMVTGHELIKREGYNPFHKTEMEFHPEDSDAFRLLFDAHPMVGR